MFYKGISLGWGLLREAEGVFPNRFSLAAWVAKETTQREAGPLLIVLCGDLQRSAPS